MVPWSYVFVFLVAFAVPNDNCLAQVIGEDSENLVPEVEGDLIDKELVHASLPEVRLASIDGYADDATYARAMSERAEGLAHRAGGEREESVRVKAWLAAANTILAFELEPACTRRFYHLDVENVPVSADLTAALLRAESSLQKAGETIETVRARDGNDVAWLAAAARDHRTLSALSRGLSEYLSPSTGADQVSKAREAASALAILMEDSDERMVAAATLWHAALRAREEDPSAALTVLPMTASDPPKSAMPHAYFSRLLRCELLARRGGYGVALALLAKMDEPVGTWFGTGAPRDEAMRSLAWTKLRVLKLWHTELMKSEANATEAAWCAQRMQEIIADRLPEDRRTLLRISPAAPVIAEDAVVETQQNPEKGK